MGSGRGNGRHQSQHSPALNKVLEIFGPRDAISGFIFQLRNWLANNIRKEVDETGAGLHLCSIGREGKAVLSDFEERDAEGPDVRGNGIGLARDAFRGHVVRGADEGVGVAFGAELAADAKVTQFNLTVAA
jgi:hypothetical protein